MQIRRLIWLLIFAVSGCADYQIKESAWSNELPPEEYFLKSYMRDSINSNLQPFDQYLTWIKRFYQGWEVYPNGWNNVTQDLLHKIKDPVALEEIKQQMDRLGKSISGEWAKNNATRRINTQHVSIWGNALLKSVEYGETSKILDRITADVDDLLGNRISADVITENRFYIEEDIFKDIN
jgi:hypothetical protein